MSPLVHVHGITFFAWYMLLAAQAALVRAREVKLHRTLGLATIVFGALMIVVGFVVSVVRVDDGIGPNADPFWAFTALPIFAIWLLFTGFYVAAIVYRHRPAEHKRFMLLASAAALSAATFRIVGFTIGNTTTLNIIGFVLPTVFIFIAMFDEYRQRQRVHRGLRHRSRADVWITRACICTGHQPRQPGATGAGLGGARRAAALLSGQSGAAGTRWPRPFERSSRRACPGRASHSARPTSAVVSYSRASWRAEVEPVRDSLRWRSVIDVRVFAERAGCRESVMWRT